VLDIFPDFWEELGECISNTREISLVQKSFGFGNSYHTFDSRSMEEKTFDNTVFS
jgi:hypothetical protein